VTAIAIAARYGRPVVFLTVTDFGGTASQRR
jgi:hypothetical protein